MTTMPSVLPDDSRAGCCAEVEAVIRSNWLLMRYSWLATKQSGETGVTYSIDISRISDASEQFADVIGTRC